MKGKWISYSKTELAWIKACADLPRAELHALFVQIFNRPEITETNLKSLCQRRGWGTGRTGRFAKGQEPPNKGKTMPYHPNSAATQFKKGQRPHSYRGAGHERVDAREGYVVMIVAERNPWTGAATRPVFKHKYLWEQANGPVPEGHCLKCLDGDKTNCDPANWVAIPRAMLPRLNGRFGRDYENTPAELKPTILAIARLEHRAGEAKRLKPKESVD